jgi:Fur family ferric uptake transcriptional regulator
MLSSGRTENRFQLANRAYSMRVETLERALAAKGHKLTQPRRAVIKVMAAAKAALTPAEIHGLAQATYKHTGLVTVYRTLSLLAECGLVQRVHGADDCHAYAPVADGHAHHLVCNNCRSTIEFENCDLDKLVSALQHRTGFTISGHWLELFGYCPKCRA